MPQGDFYIDEENGNQIEQDKGKADFEYKKKAVQFMKDNTGWKFDSLHNRFRYLEHRNYIPRWKKQVEMGMEYSITEYDVIYD